MPRRPPRPPDEVSGRVDLRLTDFDSLAAFFFGWNGRFEQLSAGPFEGELHAACGELVRVMSVEANQTILARGRGAPGLFSLYIVGDGNAGGLWHGHRLDPGPVVIHGADAETDHCSARHCKSFGLSLPAVELNRVARAVTNRDLIPVGRGWAVVETAPDAVGAINRRVRRLLGTDHDAAGARRVEHDLLCRVVEVVFPKANERRLQLPLPARTALTRRAEELMRSHLGKPLGAIDLCEMLGVSDRTLRLAFRERFGLGPMAYYQSIRLNAVRAVLASAGCEKGSIAVVGRRFGFHHAGEFTGHYRRQFGETPSETLATARAIRAGV